MSDEKCILDPERDCLGLNKAKEVAGDVKELDRRLTEFQQAVSDTNGRFGARIGKLEASDEVRGEQLKNIREKLADIARDMAESQQEQKNSISELRREHKESMEELKKGNKEILDIVTPLKHKVGEIDKLSEDVDELKKGDREILDIVTPLKHKVGEIDKLSEDVDELKEKPGETWEHIKKQGLGWIVALILAILAVALGLDKYL